MPAIFLFFAQTSKHVIYDIGTEILSLTKNYHTTFVLIFGRNIFRRGARGECPASEILNFEILYLAEAPAGNAPLAKSCFFKEGMYVAIELFTLYLAGALSGNALPVKFWISKLYIPRKCPEQVPREKKDS